MMCYWQRTDGFNITEQMKIELSSKMDCYSRKTTKKQAASNTTKFLYQTI